MSADRLAMTAHTSTPATAHWALAFYTNSSNPRAQRWYYLARVVELDGKIFELYRENAFANPEARNQKLTRDAAKKAGYSLLTGIFYRPIGSTRANELIRSGAKAPRPRTGKRIIATFVPQAWVNNYAVSTDPDGETAIDITEFVLDMGREAALSLKNDTYETDELRSLPHNPQWIRDWSGPFYVDVEDAIAAYYAAN